LAPVHTGRGLQGAWPSIAGYYEVSLCLHKKDRSPRIAQILDRGASGIGPRLWALKKDRGEG
jgi:hypothetical protein